MEVGVDGAWSDADLGRAVGDHAWFDWSYDWQAAVGDHELMCRATDASGAVQPLDQPWNYEGAGNNMVQRVAVSVR